MRLMESPDDFTGPVNLGNPEEFTIRELADKVGRLTNSRNGTRFAPLPPDDPRQRCPDITLARDKLGWRPKTSLDEGLKPTVAYFRELVAP